MKNPLLNFSIQPFGTIPFKDLKNDHFIRRGDVKADTAGFGGHEKQETTAPFVKIVDNFLTLFHRRAAI